MSAIARAAAPAENVSTTLTYPTTAPATIDGIEKFARVSDTLYRGAQPTAEGFAQLKRMGVKTIVSLRSLHSDADLLKGTGLNYVRIGCNAWHPEDEDVFEFLKIARDPRNQPVFVHCAQGVDRTGMMVAAYRVVEQGWTAEEAVMELRAFGYHPIWAGIKKHVEQFDMMAIRGHLGVVSTLKIDQIK